MSNDQRDERIKKLNAFHEAGINPYPAGPFIKTDLVKVNGLEDRAPVEIAGRIMLFREMGNITFLHIQDESGRLQVVVSKKELTDQNYKFWIRNLDIGDFLGVKGERYVTQKGEVSVLAHELTLLTKSLRPLPDKHKSIQDVEKRLRQRYLDIMLNDETRQLVYYRDRFWNSMRAFLKSKGFIEVHTPVLETSTGGADARPFVTHHNALDLDVYLRISMGELWQKRLMVAGLEKTFEIGRQFRNEGMDAEHLQDYMQMEFYWAYANFQLGMDLVKDLYRHVAQETFGTLKFQIKGQNIDLGQEWQYFDYAQTVLDMTGIDINNTTLGNVQNKLNELGVEYDHKGFNLTRAIDNLWKYCRRQLVGPGFLINEPLVVSPLAKRCLHNPQLVERFHPIIAGSEIGNGYSELNDPLDQAERFQEQEQLRQAGDEEAQMKDDDFVEALEYGMPPTCGFGTSERLLWFLLDKSGRECQLFPLMRPA